MSSFIGISTKLDESSIFTSHSFIVLFVLALRELLDIDVIEGVTRLTIGVGINSSLMTSKPAEPIADAAMHESLLLPFLIVTTQRIFYKNCDRK